MPQCHNYNPNGAARKHTNLMITHIFWGRLIWMSDFSDFSVGYCGLYTIAFPSLMLPKRLVSSKALEVPSSASCRHRTIPQDFADRPTSRNKSDQTHPNAPQIRPVLWEFHAPRSHIYGHSAKFPKFDLTAPHCRLSMAARKPGDLWWLGETNNNKQQGDSLEAEVFWSKGLRGPRPIPSPWPA